MEGTQRVKELALGLRRASTAIRVSAWDRLRYWVYYIALAHRGVPVVSSTLDAQYEDGFYQRGYTASCERINRRLASVPAKPAVLAPPSFAHDELTEGDFRVLMRARVPFVIRDGSRGLPVRDWTLEYLEEVAGTCAVPINDATDRPDEDQSRPTKAHHYYEFRKGTLADVVASIRSGGHARVAAAEDVMYHDDARLRRDIGIPRWERISGWERNQRHWLRRRLCVGKVFTAQLLVQPGGAFTLWHAEPGDNFFVLVKGVKTWELVHPYYTAAMRPRVKASTNYAGSNIDSREPDDVQRRRGFAGYVNVPKLRVTLAPGDVLRVPNHWWHTATTDADDYAIAVTARAESGPNLVGPGYMLLRLFDPQYHAIVKALIEEGRICDSHIGFPRPSRTVPGETDRGPARPPADRAPTEAGSGRGDSSEDP